MESNFTKLIGIVTPGHQVASGNAKNSPYEQGTLKMQLPFFKTLGLDLSGFFLARWREAQHSIACDERLDESPVMFCALHF